MMILDWIVHTYPNKYPHEMGADEAKVVDQEKKICGMTVCHEHVDQRHHSEHKVYEMENH